MSEFVPVAVVTIVCVVVMIGVLLSAAGRPRSGQYRGSGKSSSSSGDGGSFLDGGSGDCGGSDSSCGGGD